MRVRYLNRSRPLRVWFVLGSVLGGTALAGAPACNSIIGNEEGHLASSGSAGASASAGTSASGGSNANSGTSSIGGTSSLGGTSSVGGVGGTSSLGGTSSVGGVGGSAIGGTSSIGGTGGGGAGGAGPTGPYCPGMVTPCGGNLVGTWEVKSACLIIPAKNPTLPAECEGGDAYQRYGLTGTVTYTATSWEEQYTRDILETLTYSSECASALHEQSSQSAGGSGATFPAPPNTANCMTIADAAQAQGASTATCPYAQPTLSCNCALTFTDSGTTGDTYTLNGNQYINANAPVGYPVSYCVQTTGGVTTLTTSRASAAGYIYQHVLTLSSR